MCLYPIDTQEKLGAKHNYEKLTLCEVTEGTATSPRLVTTLPAIYWFCFEAAPKEGKLHF